MPYHPPIDDPTNNGTLDARGLCDRCGKARDEDGTVFGEQLCDKCKDDAEIEDARGNLN